jgi:DNA-binding transcriptional regulator LsrR (DeoR family)
MNASEPLTSREIAERTQVADTTIWRGLERLRNRDRIRPVDTQPFRWQTT